MSAGTAIGAELAPLRRRLAWIGAVAGAVALLWGAFDVEQLLESWLLAWLFWLAFALGSMGLVMVQHLTGGRWGAAIRPVLEAATRTLPLVTLGFVPIALGVHSLYEWSHEDVLAADEVLAHKRPYLNVPFFLARAAFYFAVWNLLALLLRRGSLRLDAEPTARTKHRLRLVSAPGLLAYGVTMTFAAFDWAMSLEPHWFSSIYGMIFLVGQALTALAFAIVVTAWLSRREGFRERFDVDQFHDLGKLLFALVLLWAYVGFSQFLIIWSGNIAEETPWYLHRLGHGWQAIALLLVLLHFFLPFGILLLRRSKRRVTFLASVAAALLFLRFVDLFWLIAPAFHPDSLAVHPIDLALVLAIGAAWTIAFLRRLAARPIVTEVAVSEEGGLEPVTQP